MRDPVFVLLHGSPGTKATWTRVLDMAPEGADVVAIDLPDHGSTPDVLHDDPVAFEQVATTELERIAAGRSLVVAGISFGAYLASRLAKRISIERLVLVAGLPHPRAGAAEQFESLAQGVQSGQLGQHELLALYRELWTGDASPDDVDPYLRALAEDHRPARIARQLRRMARILGDKCSVESHDVPCRVLHGRGDAAVPLLLGEKLAGLSSSAELIILETSSHLLPLSHPEAVTRTIFTPP